MKPSLRQRRSALAVYFSSAGNSVFGGGHCPPAVQRLRQNVETEGIDIVLAMDISGSMLAEDFKPNRIEAAAETGGGVH